MNSLVPYVIGPFSLFTKNRDMKTRDVSHCRVLITLKTGDVSSDEIIVKFLEELRMPSLLVQSFPV